MKQSNGSFRICGRESNYKTLKHYRWVHNKIVHEVVYSEENMCCENDTIWLKNFYQRIMNRTDTLELLYTSIQQKDQGKNNSHTQTVYLSTVKHKKLANNAQQIGCASSIAAAFIVATFITLVCFVIILNYKPINFSVKNLPRSYFIVKKYLYLHEL